MECERGRTLCTFETALAHSLGWSALSTKMSRMKSTVPGSTCGGSVLEDRSQTAAWMVPTGGAVYSGLFWDKALSTEFGCRPQTLYLHELHGVI